jgi:SHS2 domain-containing protein
MPYRYLDHIAIADAAFEATGNTTEELFIAAADATLGIMIEDASSLPQYEDFSFRIEADNLEMLLFDFLQELIFVKDARGLLLKVNRVHIETAPELHKLTAKAWAVPLGHVRQRLLRDVKAVTFHRFLVRQDGSRWTATVVLDI